MPNTRSTLLLGGHHDRFCKALGRIVRARGFQPNGADVLDVLNNRIFERTDKIIQSGSTAALGRPFAYLGPPAIPDAAIRAEIATHSANFAIAQKSIALQHIRNNQTTNRDDPRKATDFLERKYIMRKFLIPVVAAAGLMGVAAPASAGQVTVRVSYADLDLSSPSDVDQMKTRINRAVTHACDSLLLTDEGAKECISNGTTRALEQLDAKRQMALASGN